MTPTSLREPKPSGPQSGAGVRFLAVCGSVLFPGIGHWLVGYKWRGAVWFAAMLASLVLFYLLIVSPAWALVALAFNGIRIAIHVGSIVDSAWVAGQPLRSVHGTASARYLLGMLLIVGAAVVWLGWRAVAPIGLRAAGVYYQAITTQAMRPTIQPGDDVVAHRTESLRRWDIVLFHPPGRQDIFTRRIVGLPGEKVEIVGDQLRINDSAVPLPPNVGPYASHVPYGPQTGCEGHPIVLGPAEYFVLCDNPDSVDDSRVFGAVPGGGIMGRVTAVTWPLHRVRRVGD